MFSVERIFTFKFHLNFMLAFLILFISGPESRHTLQAQEQSELFSQEQLEQLVAPIALHPDNLLAQILMASTYPLEVVQANRWVKENPGVKDEALETAMESQEWDPSIKSLAAFPQVLKMMSDELDWTQQLGDAFLAQQEEVFDAVQILRSRADKAGNLESTKEQKVEKQQAKSSGGKQNTVYIIEQADPKIIYVPAYNPVVIYGAWPYRAYPPYYWYPPGYVARRAFWFATGIIVGRAIWGRCDWRRRSIHINIRVYNSFNRTRITSSRWRHNPRHRRAVPYRGKKVKAKYRPQTRDVKARERFRGRAEDARRDLPRPSQLPSNNQRPALKPEQRPGGGQRPAQLPNTGQKPAQRPAQLPNKDQKPAQRPAQLPNKGQKPAQKPAQLPNTGQRPAQKPAVQRPAQQRPVQQRPAQQRPVQRPAQNSRPKPKTASRPATRPTRPQAKPKSTKRPAAYQNIGKGKQVRKQSARGKSSRQAAGKGGGGLNLDRKRR